MTVLHKYKVSSKYSKRFSSYGADTKLHLKPSRRNNSESMKGRVSFLYATHCHDLFYITVDGWMTCAFTSFLTVFQSHQDDVWMIMKGCVQWNSVYG